MQPPCVSVWMMHSYLLGFLGCTYSPLLVRANMAYNMNDLFSHFVHTKNLEPIRTYGVGSLLTDLQSV